MKTEKKYWEGLIPGTTAHVWLMRLSKKKGCWWLSMYLSRFRWSIRNICKFITSLTQPVTFYTTQRGQESKVGPRTEREPVKSTILKIYFEKERSSWVVGDAGVEFVFSKQATEEFVGLWFWASKRRKDAGMWVLSAPSFDWKLGCRQGRVLKGRENPCALTFLKIVNTGITYHLSWTVSF